MATKGCPRLNFASGSPKMQRFIPTTSGTKKKKSPRSIGAKKSGESPKVKQQRADWNAAQEKSLVDILYDFKDSSYRGDNGWSSEGWTKIVKEFHRRNKHLLYSRAQLQEKEGQLKRDYKMLKEARKQSGASWNHARNMVEGPETMWDNLIVTFPKIKKFRNNKSSFPLYDAMGEIYDGHLAEGTHNIVSLESPKQQEEPLLQMHGEDQGLGEYDIEGEGEGEDPEVQEMEDVTVQDQETEVQLLEVVTQRKRGPTASKKEEKDGKRPRRGAVIEGIMQEYLQLRKKQAEDETALAKEKEREAREKEEKDKEAAHGSDYSIKRCITALDCMAMSKEEKAKAYSVFIKSQENRAAFISACEVDPDVALIWLRNDIAK